MKLQGKTALITGGASGIGEGIAKKFQSEGAKTIVFDIQEPHFETEFHKVNISNEVEIAKAFESISTLDILVNNAGVYFPTNLEEITEEQFDKMFGVNIKGPFFMSKHALPLLKKSQGNVINIASVLGLAADPNSHAYCATKSALVMLTKTMSQAYVRDKVRVNAIAPGPIDTPMVRQALGTDEQIQAFANTKPIGRIGTPEDIANVALLLASEEGRFITGGIFSVDGGEAAGSVYSQK